MESTLAAAFRFLIVAVFFAGSPLAAHPRSPSASTCICNTVSVQGGWCEPCRVGHIAGLRVPSADLYDMVDAHGHDIFPSGVSCATCRIALKRNGFCERCKIGYRGGRAYVSRLGHVLALGDEAPPDILAAETDRLRNALTYLDRCQPCAVAAFTDGRCPECRIFYKGGKPTPPGAPAKPSGPAPARGRS